MAHIKTTRQDPGASRALLARSSLKPRKRLGQHFMEDQAIINKIVRHPGLHEEDVVIEIGPGLGALTIPLLSRVRQVVAVEKDPLLITLLEERVSPQDRERITFIAGDILKLEVKEVHDHYKEKIKIVGNLPYNISSAVLEKLIANRNCIKSAILMFQFEVAQRLTSSPGKKQYGSLSVITQYYAQISPFIEIPRDAFYPRPKVDSMVLEVDFERPFHPHAANDEFFIKLVKAAFSCRRKTILNSLQRGMASLPKVTIAEALGRCLIDPKRRAETLSLEEYVRLSSVLPSDVTVP
jgi:16S rRNA (adenine1518-N6/adenine1519-N6)-dimethyltransferase